MQCGVLHCYHTECIFMKAFPFFHSCILSFAPALSLASLLPFACLARPFALRRVFTLAVCVRTVSKQCSSEKIVCLCWEKASKIMNNIALLTMQLKSFVHHKPPKRTHSLVRRTIPIEEMHFYGTPSSTAHTLRSRVRPHSSGPTAMAAKPPQHRPLNANRIQYGWNAKSVW